MRTKTKPSEQRLNWLALACAAGACVVFWAAVVKLIAWML